MLIEIDGSPLEKPDFCKDLLTQDYLEGIRLAHNVRGYPGMIELLSRMDQSWNPVMVPLTEISDEEFDSLIVGAVKANLPNRPEFNRYKGMFANILAGKALPKSLELVDVRAKKTPVPCLGMDLRSPRSIILRGDAADIRGLSGGNLHINGNVDELIASKGGRIYVNGDLQTVGDYNESCLVIVAGKYNPRPKEGVQMAKGMVFAGECKPSSNVFQRYDLANWRPEDVGPRISRHIETMLVNAHQAYEELAETVGRLDVNYDLVKRYISNPKT